MVPRILIDTAQVPDGGGELRLIQRGQEFSIMLGSNELMNSRLSGSEEALAKLAAEAIGTRQRARVLIGGLGMGFTLRAALAELGPDAEIDVAELVPAVVTWAKGPMAHIFGDCMDDPRVTIMEVDVASLIATGRGRYDAILLDVDNGPDALTRRQNSNLYSRIGLSLARQALTLGGVFGVWSAAPDSVFTNRLRRADFDVREVVSRATASGKGARHVIWIGTRA